MRKHLFFYELFCQKLKYQFGNRGWSVVNDLSLVSQRWENIVTGFLKITEIYFSRSIFRIIHFKTSWSISFIELLQEIILVDAFQISEVIFNWFIFTDCHYFRVLLNQKSHQSSAIFCDISDSSCWTVTVLKIMIAPFMASNQVFLMKKMIEIQILEIFPNRTKLCNTLWL